MMDALIDRSKTAPLSHKHSLPPLSHSSRLSFVMIPLYLSLVAFSCLSFAGAEPIHFPLKKRNTVPTIDDYAHAADLVRIKYGFPPGSTTSKRQNSAAVPVINQVCSLPIL